MFELILISYLIGSIPFGLVLAKAFGYGDIRKIGSGNIGATNVLRTGSKPLALAAFIGDIIKGYAAIYIAQNYFSDFENAVYIAGFVAMIGHIFSIWVGFKGGRGVSTGLGVLLALDPFIAALSFSAWFVVATLSRISSLASLIATLHSPVYAVAAGHAYLAPFLCLLAALIWCTHRDNIQRLLDGSESKIGDTVKKPVKKKAPAQTKAAVKKKTPAKKSSTKKKAPVKKKTTAKKTTRAKKK